ncbi:hypothetical protein [Actinoplanes sp. NPDC051411]|uniref:hypothetical protein n=1 Tax=Actinoplanes sp. NPDC051411 TaxID=3155522 RepID=UPI00343B87ED
MLAASTAWVMVRVPAAAEPGRAGATPTPSNGPGGFDWSKVYPDGSAIPKSDLFYTIMRSVMWLGGVAALCGLVCGAIAFGVGPVFGAHIVSDRGKSMMWRNGLVAIIVGSATAIVAALLVL